MFSPSPETSLPGLRRSLAAYVDGAAGIPYEDLVAFAEPLFDLYELDIRKAGRDGIREADELATLLSILDLARLFWSYLSLDDAGRHSERGPLRDALVGPQPDTAEVSAFEHLLVVMDEQWRHVRSVVVAEPPAGFVLPPFAVLLADFQQSHAYDRQADSGPETGVSDLPEAMATFARPLFEEADLEDPAAIEDALTRAQAYWELAQMPGDAYEARLTQLVDRFAGPERTDDAVRREAMRMSRRFRELFG